MGNKKMACALPSDDGETLERSFYSVSLPSSIDGEGWTTHVEEGKPLEIQCIGDDGHWSIHLTCLAGEQRFEVEANAWDVDVTEVLPKIAQIVTEQVGDGNLPVRLKLEVTYY
jgi:hypothetical protein